MIPLITYYKTYATMCIFYLISRVWVGLQITPWHLLLLLLFFRFCVTKVITCCKVSESDLFNSVLIHNKESFIDSFIIWPGTLNLCESLKRADSLESLVRKPDCTGGAVHVFNSLKRTDSKESFVRDSGLHCRFRFSSGCALLISSAKTVIKCAFRVLWNL